MGEVRSPSRSAGNDAVDFGEFRFDLSVERLWKGDEELPLRPKTAGVLRELIVHAGEVVNKRELFDTVWSDVVVGDAVLAVCINELRRALDDDAQQPRYIATAHRRGYRFVSPVTWASAVRGSTHQRAAPFVGRDMELAMLVEWWEQALAGRRQIVFVAGEPGIGKTALVDVFVDRVRSDDVLVGRGHCVERFGEGEPYLPLLEALGQLCRGLDGERVRDALSTLAPTWLLQMPGLVTPAEVEDLRLRTLGAPRERMLRELADALEAMTAVRPLAVVCEDLHASDRSTVELLGYLAGRRHPARMLVMGTYRPADVVLRDHPLRRLVQDLRGRRMCRFLPLELLSEASVEAYLVARLAPERPSAALVGDIVQRTDGNALFLVTVVDYLVARGMLVGDDHGEVRCRDPQGLLGVPDSVRQMIDRQIDELDQEDRRLLEIAAVAGVEFPTEVVAAADPDAGLDGVEAEDRCGRLARDTSLLVEASPERWPDGTATARYRFGHAMYQETLYDRLGPARRRGLHRRIGERLEAGHGDRSPAIAVDLATHFERAHVAERALRYLAHAAETALERRAPTEALDYTDRALDLLAHSPPGPMRSLAELRLRMTQAAGFIATRGVGAPEVDAAYAAARRLSRDVDDPTVLTPVRFSLWNFAITRARIRDAADVAAEIEALVPRGAEPAMRLSALNCLAITNLFAGELAAGQAYIDEGLDLYEPGMHRRFVSYFEDPSIVCQWYAAFAAWLSGYPDRGREHADEALRLAETLASPDGACKTLWSVAVVFQLCGDVARVRDLGARLLDAATTLALPVWQAGARILHGWAVARGGEPHRVAADIGKSLAALAALGNQVLRPYQQALFAEVSAMDGDLDGAIDASVDALAAVEQTGERWYEAELLRLRAELTIASTAAPGEPVLEAEKLLGEAIDIARRQGARSFELRAATSLARLHFANGRSDLARADLAEPYGWFTEGHDTADLRSAAELLAGLDRV
jgi:DNA-binding winged helix-turn-helix (wHTH) protein/predicted ATPase